MQWGITVYRLQCINFYLWIIGLENMSKQSSDRFAASPDLSDEVGELKVP